jgi:hypothetical protein
MPSNPTVFISYSCGDKAHKELVGNIKPNGRVFTYVEGMTTAELPRALRQTQTFMRSEAELKRLYNFINRALPPSGSPGSY